MKIRKNKKCKMILLCIVCIVIAGAAVIFTMIIKYNNKPYIQAEKIIKDACKTEGLPLISIEDGNVKNIYPVRKRHIAMKDCISLRI